MLYRKTFSLIHAVCDICSDTAECQKIQEITFTLWKFMIVRKLLEQLFFGNILPPKKKVLFFFFLLAIHCKSFVIHGSFLQICVFSLLYEKTPPFCLWLMLKVCTCTIHWVLWSPVRFLKMNCCVGIFLQLYWRGIILFCHLEPMIWRRMYGFRIYIAVGICDDILRMFSFWITDLVRASTVSSVITDTALICDIRNVFCCLKLLKGSRIFHFIILMT